MPSPTRLRKTRGWAAGAVLVTGLAGIADVVESPAQAQQAGGSCPLTVNQEVAAVKAFKQLAPILRVPRCLNCHGGVNPFIEDGGHAGGRRDVLGMTNNDEIRRSDVAMRAMHSECDNCHVQGWTIAMSENSFVNRSDKELCMYMKRDETVQTITAHMRRNDDVLTAFAGTRGLEPPEPPAKKPRMTHAFVFSALRAWIRAMGERFHQPADCGCVIHGLVLQIHHRIDTDPTDVSSSIGEVDFSGAVEFAVRLTPVPKMPDGWFTGQASLVRPIAVTHVRRDCSGTASPRKELWDFHVVVDDEAESMKISFLIDPSEEQGTLTCRGGGHTTTTELSVDVFSELMHREDLTVPITTGATKQFQATEYGTREWLNVTVMNAPGSE